ncbi:hypothetical protein ONZ45_g16244 [Pleurotus djamor]|nr:hypothetical protein ONZ45_g17822 [Pleurotus djamor]KAJ8473577.1 hypothetical protein ONZ45_g16244 [Pleurotus djamor]
MIPHASTSTSNPNLSMFIDLKRKFGGILKENSPLPRVFYAHFTSVTDTKSTGYILANLKDMLMRTNLQKSSLM